MRSMRTESSRAVLPALALCLLLLPAPTRAQAPAAPGEDAHADEPAHEGHTHDPGLDEIVVTFSGHERRRFDVIQGSSVLDEDALATARGASLGDTLAGEPGVRSTGFAPGASRPTIRGLDGPRVRVLQNGVGVADASATSPDHQVAADPLLAERIEVLRGAGTLRYGSTAVGGVVNVIDGRIPERRPEAPLEGALALGYGSNADDRGGAVALRSATGPFVWHGEAFGRRTHDLEVKGRPLSAAARATAEPGDLQLGADGRVRGTAVASHGGTLGGSWVGESGFAGLSYSRLESVYGLPVPEEEEIRVDLKQNRLDLGAGFEGALGPFEGLELSAVYGDYEHAELEGDEVGTVFLNRSFEARLEAAQRATGALDGSVGVQWRSADRDAVGTEAFLPAHESTSWGVFAVEELHLEPVTLEAGLRLERTEHDPEGGLRRRSFGTWSASLGASWAIDADSMLGISLARSERPPTAEELYSDGPHLATGGFERGDAGLEPETAWSVELTAKRRQGAVTGALNLFATRFEDYITPLATGAVVDGLEERVYRQEDATFHGLELELEWAALERGWGRFVLDLGFDLVLGRARSGGELPRIPPTRLALGAALELDRLDLRVEAARTGAQARLAPGERRTGHHLVIDLDATLRPFDDHDLSVFLQVRNATDQRGRNHVSFLKERLPIAGRDVRLGLRWRF